MFSEAWGRNDVSVGVRSVISQLSSTQNQKSKMAGVVKFVSQSELNTKKEQKRQARGEIIRRVSVEVAFLGRSLD